MDFRFWSKFKIIEVDGNSMLPNIKPNWKMIFIKKEINQINRFDIILFPHNEKLMIKRVIGLPSEFIEIKENELIINETTINEEYIDTPRFSYFISRWQLGENEHVLLGDNSNDSFDSRKIGPIILTDEVFVLKRRIWPIRLKSHKSAE